MTLRQTLTLAGSLLTLALAAFAQPLLAADWPAYRGPNSDGVSTETGLLKSWPEAGPQQLWKAELGDGYSAVSVSAGRVYTMFGDGKDEYTVAFDAATGKQLWRFRTDEDRPDNFGNGPRSTPLIEGERVFVVSALGRLYALNSQSGEVLWEVNLVAKFGAKVPTWGVSVSPLIEGDLLLIDAGGREGHSLLAFNKKTGSLKWASQTDIPGYSTPLAFTAAGQRQVVFFTGSGLVSVDPASGKPLWRESWETSYDVNAAMPIFIAPDKIFVSSGYDVGAAVFQIKKQGDTVESVEVWRSRVMKNQFNSSVLVDGFLYGFDGSTLKCVEAATGSERWKQRGFEKGSLIYADGHLIVLSERGVLALVEATPESYKEKARTEVFKTKTWTMPTLADGRLYLRSEKQLVVLDLRG